MLERRKWYYSIICRRKGFTNQITEIFNDWVIPKWIADA